MSYTRYKCVIAIYGRDMLLRPCLGNLILDDVPPNIMICITHTLESWNLMFPEKKNTVYNIRLYVVVAQTGVQQYIM